MRLCAEPEMNYQFSLLLCLLYLNKCNSAEQLTGWIAERGV